MGWSIKGRKPSPWFDLDSTREAFDAFAREEGLAKHFLPNRDMLIRLARKDMLKGADEWGGIEELAELLEYQVRLKTCCKMIFIELKRRIFLQAGFSLASGDP